MSVGAKHLEDKLSVIAKNSSPNASPVQLSVVSCKRIFLSPCLPCLPYFPDSPTFPAPPTPLLPLPSAPASLPSITLRPLLPPGVNF
ncbi:hypothetical protein [Dolichospermum sp. UHCC 0315A]|uniref:hypothetical protein n=1 Tax=Dolichospermum sp. UHCC 0315A TaxID=1914871 RepID=UPI0011E7910B|nr:hypothetical protein [Dolichospermum sp. UHCC 0315A]